MPKTDKDNPTKGKTSPKRKKKPKTKAEVKEKAKPKTKTKIEQKTKKKTEVKEPRKSVKKKAKKKMKPKTFRVSGSFMMGAALQKFQKEVTALGEKRARERIFRDLGSKHRVKRSRVVITSVEEVT